MNSLVTAQRMVRPNSKLTPTAMLLAALVVVADGAEKDVELAPVAGHGTINSLGKENAPDSADEARSLLNIGALQTGWGRSSPYLVAGAVTFLALLGTAWILFSGWLKRRQVSTVIRERAPASIAPTEDDKREKAQSSD